MRGCRNTGLNNLGRLLVCFWAIVVLLCALPSSFAYSSSPPEKIRVGYFKQEGLFTQDKNGNYSGYSYDYLQEMAQYNNWEYTFVHGTEKVCLEWLKDGKIDIMDHVYYSKDLDKDLDYSEHESGYSTVGLYAMADDVRFGQENYKTFNNKRIGIIKNLRLNDGFRNFCKNSGIKVDLIEFEEDSNLFNALNSKSIDGAFLVKNRLPQNIKIIAKFPDERFYFAVTNGNKRLLSQVNFAMKNILRINSSFNRDYTEDHFRIDKPTLPILTDEEKQYVAKNKTLIASYDPVRPPFEFLDKRTGTPSGIGPEVLKLVALNTGLKIKIIESKSYGEGLQGIKNGKVDILTGVNRNFSWGKKNHFRVSAAYLNGPIVIIANKTENLSFKNIALPKNYHLSEKIAAMYTFSKILFLPSTEDCFDAVKNGLVGATFANSYVANYLLSYGKYRNLSSINFGDNKEQIAIGISRNTDPLLLSIINKGINSIPESKLNDIIIKNALRSDNNTITDILYAHYDNIGITVAVILLFIVIILALFANSKAKGKQKIEKMHYYDKLTGYKNFNSFLEEAPVIISRNPEINYAVLYIDIVQFKYINGAFSYEEGDNVLRNVSLSICEFLDRSRETFARIYADHFVLLLSYENETALEKKIKLLFGELDLLHLRTKHGHRFIFNSGVYLIDKRDIPIKTAVDCAIFAKKTLVKKHSTVYAYYDKKIVQIMKEEQIIEASMRNALKKGEFVPYLQPKIDCSSGKIVGAESLVRWLTPDKGILAPDIFIPYFEKSGFITKLDIHIFSETCKLLRRWIDEGKDIFPISCNFSYLDIVEPSFPKYLKIIAEKNNVPANMLELELTESVAIEHVEIVNARGKELSEYGFRLSLDDFGAGYSSLTLLQILKMDVLKLDRTFVQRGLGGKLAYGLVSSLVKTFKDNSIQIVFEGIETEEQINFVKSLGCKIIQGYFYSKPIPIEEFEQKYFN